MSKRVAELTARRELLVAHSSLQRLRLGLQTAAVLRSLSFVHRGAAAVRYVKRRPVIIIVTAVLFAFLRPGRVFNGVLSCLRLWSAVRRL